MKKYRLFTILDILLVKKILGESTSNEFCRIFKSGTVKILNIV